MESLESRLQRLAALADRAELPSASAVRRRGEVRRRRRRLVVAGGSLLLLAAVATPVVFVLAGASTRTVSPTTTNPVATSPPTTPTTAPTHPTVSLPSADLFSQITVVQGSLLLSGEVASTSSSKTPTCVSATVNPQTLALGPSTTADCNDPSFYAETVGTVNENIPDSNNATVSIAHVDPQTGQTSVGPVVMTYGSFSDTRPVVAYGGGWLWIYDNSVITSGSEKVNISNPGTAELLQVSPSTGLVVDTVSMPVLYRPLLAADDDGLWMGNSVEGGQCSGCGPPSALYFVAPGSDKAVVAIPDSSLITCWLLGSGDDLWAGMGHESTGCTHESIWRLNGTDFQPVFQVPDQGYNPFTVVGDESDGLWTMQWMDQPTTDAPTSSPQEIVGINPDTGAEKVVATLPPLVVPLSGEYSGLTPQQAVVLDGSLYLLEPPLAQSEQDLGYSTLVKITLS